MENFNAVMEMKTENLMLYKKKQMILYYVSASEFAGEGEKVRLHTMEGDVYVDADEKTNIMVGPKQDIYPISKCEFDLKYQTAECVPSEEAINTYAEYGVDKSKIMGCKLKRISLIYAAPVERAFSVIKKDGVTILQGKCGDYYIRGYDDPANQYIIDKDIFKMTYEKFDSDGIDKNFGA